MTSSTARTLFPQSTPSSFEALTAAYATEMAKVNALMAADVGTQIPLIRDLTQHLMGAGGKRIRPLLSLMTARLFNYQGTAHHPLAAAVEYIHTATLLHDDVVDASVTRRGQPTANVLWSNKACILVGDFLFARAFQCMVSTQHLEVLSILSQAAASITEGEILQLNVSTNLELARQHYYTIIEAKTAPLFAAAAQASAVLADAPPSQREAIRQFGRNLGCLFQLADDFLDYGLGQATLGKKTGDDFFEGKITLPVLLAYERGTQEEQNFWQSSFAKEERSEVDFEKASSLLTLHQCGGAMQSAAWPYFQGAQEALAGLPRPTSDCQRLLDLCWERFA